MKKALRVALVGATGLLGSAIREQWAESEWQPDVLYLLASDRGAGQRLEYDGSYLATNNLAEFDFSQVDVAVFAVPAQVTAEYASKVKDAGCKLLDFSGHFLTELDVPLVCPSVIPYKPAPIAAFPGAITLAIAKLLAVPSAHDLLSGVDITAMLPVAMAGQAGVDELAAQTTALLNMQQTPNQVFPERLAFRLHDVGAKGQGSSHSALTQGTALTIKRLFGLSLPVTCQAFWLPVFYGMQLAVKLQFSDHIDQGRMEQWLDEAGINLLPLADEASDALPDAIDGAIYARLQRNLTNETSHACLSIAVDNVKLSASMAVQTLEVLIKNHLY